MTQMLLTGPDLKHARNQLGITQQALADRMGVSVATVTRIEQRYIVKPATARRFQDALATFPSLTSPVDGQDAA